MKKATTIITLGDKDFTLTRPKSLQTVADSFGLSVSELAAQLPEAAIPGFVAGALQPFLPGDAPQGFELAALIAPNLVTVRAAVAALYAEPAND